MKPKDPDGKVYARFSVLKLKFSYLSIPYSTTQRTLLYVIRQGLALILLSTTTLAFLAYAHGRVSVGNDTNG